MVNRKFDIQLQKFTSKNGNAKSYKAQNTILIDICGQRSILDSAYFGVYSHINMCYIQVRNRCSSLVSTQSEKCALKWVREWVSGNCIILPLVLLGDVGTVPPVGRFGIIN